MTINRFWNIVITLLSGKSVFVNFKDEYGAIEQFAICPNGNVDERHIGGGKGCVWTDWYEGYDEVASPIYEAFEKVRNGAYLSNGWEDD